jgi:hypothetical protein
VVDVIFGDQNQKLSNHNVVNGLSYLSEDIAISRFIMEEGFPPEFNDETDK